MADEESTTTTTPDNANAACVGPESSEAGKASSCEGCPNRSACASGEFNTPEAKAKARAEAAVLRDSLDVVSHVVLVLSGKGGVGKSTVAAQLCHTLAAQGYAVGLLDVDLCGPSAPRMVLGDAYQTSEVHRSASGSWVPVYASPNLAVMSISFLLQNPKEAVVWRGPRKDALIGQFLTEVDWTGDTDGLDYLIVDTPPGTSDEHISTVQLLQKAKAVSGAVIVTTPEEVSLADVRKELNFCEKTRVPILGVIENMGTFQTPLRSMKFLDRNTGEDRTAAILAELQQKCPELLGDDLVVSTDIFSSTSASGGGGARAMAREYNVPFMGSLPLDTKLLQCCETGTCFVDAHPTAIAAQTMKGFAKRLSDDLPVDM